MRALSIFFLEFRFPGPAQCFLALQRFLGLVGNRSLTSSLDIRLRGWPVLIPATPAPVAPGPIAAAAALIVGVPIGPLLLPPWRL